jgi:hypothetical protein
MKTDILTMPRREAPATPRLHRALLWLLACVCVTLILNLVLLFRVGALFLDISASREAESSHQRLVNEMQKREMANHAMILVEQERMLKRLRAMVEGE